MISIDKEGYEGRVIKLTIKQGKKEKIKEKEKMILFTPDKVSFPPIRMHITIMLIGREVVTRFLSKRDMIV